MQSFLIALTVALWSIVGCLNKIVVGKINPIYDQIVVAVVGLLLIPAFYYFVPKHTPVTMNGILWAAGTGLLAIVGGALYMVALSKGNITTVLGYASTYPLFTFLLATVFLGESFTWCRCFGMLFIVGGAFLLGR